MNVEPAWRRPVGADLDQIELGIAVALVDGAKVLGIAGVDLELRALRREVLNRLHVQMIVVVVRDQHGIDAREVRELDRRRVRALRPDRQDPGEFHRASLEDAGDLLQLRDLQAGRRNGELRRGLRGLGPQQ